MDEQKPQNMSVTISEKLALLEKGNVQNWWDCFCLLRDIESTQYWDRSADSFTQWVVLNCTLFGKKASQLWRIISAGRFLDSFYQRYYVDNKNGFEARPTLESLAEVVRPEHLELLWKLERVMPHDRFIEIVLQVLAGELSRLKLRGMWDLYRPILQGKTARGRGVEAPQVDVNNASQRLLQENSAILDMFSRSNCAWLCNDNPKLFRIFMQVIPDGSKSKSASNFLFPVVVVVKCHNRNLSFHGFRWLDLEVPSFEIEKMMEFCDFLWFLVKSNQTFDVAIDGPIPYEVGILKVDEHNITVVRQAMSLRDRNEMRSVLSDEILERVLSAK